MIEHPQGFRRAGTLDEDVATRLGMLDEKNKPLANPLWMPSSLEAFENLMIEGKLHVAVNPVMRWNVASAVVRDDPAGTGNRVFDKRRATGRIDGVVAGAMALGAATARFNGEGGREFQIFFVA
jgi:phage terminase large subunit-like protein